LSQRIAPDFADAHPGYLLLAVGEQHLSLDRPSLGTDAEQSPMSTLTKIITIGIRGEQRLLFRVEERASGDLTIIIKNTIFSYSGLRATDNDRIREQRCSVHCSPQSPNTNVIKLTTIMRDGRASYSRNYTQALKRKGQFAGIFIRRVADLSDPRYAVKANPNVISLGDYDPTAFHPVFMVFVGDVDRDFSLPGFENVNFLEIIFTRFRLIVLWQFLAIDCDGKTAGMLTLATYTPEEINAAAPHERPRMINMLDGFSPDMALYAFHQLKGRLADELIDATQRVHCDLNPSYYEVAKKLDLYVQHGTRDTQEFKELVGTMTAEVLAHNYLKWRRDQSF
jgi:hypothetical protein